ncbi:MAG TPA: 50S ribosomal protein L23 [Planctomycetota bacterium]|nr:50S ribosomal protein L23 [Planctomycetota bacterium]
MSRNRASHLLSDPYAVLRRPIMTEKSHDMAAAPGEDKQEENKKRRYTFEVHPKANKNQIKAAIESAFSGVKVDAVNTMMVKPRKKSFRGGARVPGFSRIRKKAVIRLTKGSKQIDLM